MAVTTSRRRPRRLGVAERRTAGASAAAVAGLALAFGAGASWSVAVLVAWDAAAVAYLASAWASVAFKDAAETAQHAQDEDNSRRASEAVLVNASVASLVAVAFTLAEAGGEHHAARAGLTIFALVSVALAWTCVHTVYMLRYARLYYAQPVGGIGFADDEPPQYLDFAYLSFTIGMTFQVSDTDLSKKRIRRTAIHHALLSYFFGAVILAVAINAVGGLLG
jgi:uncharacterized membrane protein